MEVIIIVSAIQKNKELCTLSCSPQFCKFIYFVFIFQHDGSPEDKIGAWFIRAKTVAEEDKLEGETCPKEGCPAKTTLEHMPKLGPDDTVFIFIHGNAKVRNINVEFIWN